MKLTGADTVAGICSITVRNLAEKLRLDDYYRWWVEAYLAAEGVENPSAAVDRLALEGYVALSADGEGSPTVSATAQGEALTLFETEASLAGEP